VFNDVIRPLMRIAGENGPVTKLARALLTINDYIHEDPERLETLANIAAFAATKVGQQRGQGAVDQANQDGHLSSQVTRIAGFRVYYRPQRAMARSDVRRVWLHAAQDPAVQLSVGGGVH